MKTSRRTFLLGTSVIATSTLSAPLAALAAQKTQKKAAKKEEPEEDVSTNEDLMREHGVLNRVLLIYDEAMRRIQANEKFDPAVITSGLFGSTATAGSFCWRRPVLQAAMVSSDCPSYRR